ncbi:MAG: hypothetical protein DRG78_05980 [Epsilonproteobacteria bacterium]|nr:MAG: hypothetical protein DRG78_05980 [Campylobacterota bacterium]
MTTKKILFSDNYLSNIEEKNGTGLTIFNFKCPEFYVSKFTCTCNSSITIFKENTLLCDNIACQDIEINASTNKLDTYFFLIYKAKIPEQDILNQDISNFITKYCPLKASRSFYIIPVVILNRTSFKYNLTLQRSMIKELSEYASGKNMYVILNQQLDIHSFNKSDFLYIP